MRFAWIVTALLGFVVWSCGNSSSSKGLFSNTQQCSAGAVTECTDAVSNCTGHATCGSDGKPGPCVCDAMPQGTGGIIAGSGGITMSTGGTPFGGAGGFSGSSNTGGSLPFGSGGFGGIPDASFGSGGAGGAPAVCPTGHYAGMYSGMYGSLLNKQQVSGNIDFTVDVSGNVVGRYSGTMPNNGAKADLHGTFDCSTSALTMNVENGTYPGILGNVHFTGTMPGTYSSESQSWSGTWNLSDDNSQSGSGTWTAR